MPEDLYNNTIGDNDWSSVSAVKNEQVYKMPLGAYRSFTPGADTPMTLMWLAKTVYPDLFDDVDMTEEVENYYKEVYNIELTDDQVAQCIHRQQMRQMDMEAANKKENGYKAQYCGRGDNPCRMCCFFGNGALCNCTI